MVIEVDYVAGRQTRDGIAELLAAGLEDVVDKPGGVEVIFDEEIPVAEPDGGWTFAQLQQLVGEYENLEVDDNTIATYTLLVDGRYAESEGNVLGIAWANRYAVLFIDRIEQACQGVAILRRYVGA